MSDEEINLSHSISPAEVTDQTKEENDVVGDEESKDFTETVNKNGTQETVNKCQDVQDKTEDNTFVDEKTNDIQKENAEENILNESDKNTSSNQDVKEMKTIHLMKKIDELDEKYLLDYLQDVPEDELLDALNEIENMISYISKENEVYEFILNENEAYQDSSSTTEIDEENPIQETLTLSYPAKCYFAKKKLEHVEEELQLKKAEFDYELQNLRFELESLNMTLKDLTESKEKFDKYIRIGGRHPVTKKIILQKVAKFFDDSIRKKMALTNRYRIQIQSDIMERNKILSQIKAQEKRLSSLDMTKFQETQFEHKKSCRQLAVYKARLGKLKEKFSPLLQSIAEMKKSLEKEQNEMEQMKNAVSKLEHLKEVMYSEKARNDEKIQELKATMRKIKLDPRRHNLPEVIDYAATKRENAALQKNIIKWKKKLEIVQQKKFLSLSVLSKKNI